MKLEISRDSYDLPDIKKINGIYQIWDLAMVKGTAVIHFENGDVGASIAPVLINYLEIRRFFKNICLEQGISKLDLFFEPTAYCYRESDELTFTRFNPRSVDVCREDNLLEIGSLDNAVEMLDYLESVKGVLYGGVSLDLVNYLENIPMNDRIGLP